MKRFLVCIAVLLVAATAFADPITVDNPNWYEFEFAGVDTYVAKGGGIPSGGDNSEFAPNAPWTFSGAVNFTVVDAFRRGDQFAIYDFGVLLGFTSYVDIDPPLTDTNDPAVAILDPTYSSGIFVLPAGDHSITIRMVASPSGGGAAYFKATSVPEPATMLLLGAGLIGLAGYRKKLFR